VKTIWKFELAAQSELKMPEGATVLAIQTQVDSSNPWALNETPVLWALVDPEAPTEKRRFRAYGTGHSLPESSGAYIGTFQIYGGKLIFHVFEEQPFDGGEDFDGTPLW
jgi:hypothetical protein